jgi:hypothetical protein
MRKIVMLTFYLALVAVGSWFVYDWITYGGHRGFLFRSGGFLALFGLYLIWMDFLSPDREKF